MEMDKLGVVTSFVHNIVVYNIPLLYGTVGEIMVEKSGSLNLGVEGIMAVGAIFGYIIGCYTNSLLIGILTAFLAGALCGLLFAALTVSLQANQNITGLTLTTFGLGVYFFVGNGLKAVRWPAMNDYSGIKNGFANLPIPGLSKLPLIGEGLFDHNLLVYLGLNGILWRLRVPAELCPLMKDYLLIIFLGIAATFLYNYFANLLRAIGNSVVPLAFLTVSAILNVILDLVCVLVLDWGVKGAAVATVFSQYVSGVGIGLYTLKKFPQLCPKRTDCRWDRKNLANILNLSVMTSVQQSIMNFGILMVQGLVNSFGTVIMAAFAAAVKIDSFAYMPVQDFGNAFSTYVAQNYGAGQPDRIKKGIRSAGLTSAVFCIVISVLVCAFAAPLMGGFIDPAQTEIIAAGVQYLRIEGACYIGIGVLFLLYGYYRAINQPGMSVILTIASLGTRVALAYLLSATPLGVTGIWLSVPIGWALADAIGIGYYLKKRT